MNLVTKEIRDRTPLIDETATSSDPLLTAKFFDPCGSWTWYLIELDTDNDTAYGYVEGHYNELGYFSIKELESIKRPYGLRIERDVYFEPTPYSTIKKQNIFE